MTRHMNKSDMEDNKENIDMKNNEADSKKKSDDVDQKNKSTFIKNRYIASFLLYGLGDKIGFKNSDWKMDYGRPASAGTINEFVYEFIDLGGINGIDLSNWNVSAETFYNISIAKSMLKYNGKTDKKFIVNVKNKLIESYNESKMDLKNGIKRYDDDTTQKYLVMFTLDDDARNKPYDSEANGNGVVSRSISIGLSLYKKENLEELIETSITLGRLTHNSPIGFLPGFTIAYFASLAINNIDIALWPHMMIKILESQLITQYLDMTVQEIRFDYMDYVRYWKKYIDTRFVDTKPIKNRSTSNLIFRTRYYYENFVKDTKINGIGVSGFCACIMAYDVLLDCDGKWEKIIFYGILNPSDSNVIGAICGGLYGAMYGFGDVPEHMLEHLEKGEILFDLGKKIHKKFYVQ